MKKQVIIILSAICLATMLIGCSTKSTAPAASASVSQQASQETAQEDYKYLDSFIAALSSYSDGPELQGDELDAYYKGEYDIWKSGEGYTNIKINPDGTYIVEK